MLVREALLSDVARIAEIHILSWQSVYKGLLPAGFLDSLDIEERRAMWTSCIESDGDLFVVEAAAGGIGGFLCLGSASDEDLSGPTELKAIYLDPRWYGSGMGTLFWNKVENGLCCELVFLWVLESNCIGIAFYEKNGFEPDGKTKTFEIGGEVFTELRYSKSLSSNN